MTSSSRADTSTARNTASRAASSNSAHRATESASAPGSRLRRSRSGRRRERRRSAISSRTARSSRPTFSIDGDGRGSRSTSYSATSAPALVAVDRDHTGTRLDLDDRDRLTRRQRPHVGNPGEHRQLVLVAAGEQQRTPVGGLDGTPELVGRRAGWSHGARQDHRSAGGRWGGGNGHPKSVMYRRVAIRNLIDTDSGFLTAIPAAGHPSRPRKGASARSDAASPMVDRSYSSPANSISPNASQPASIVWRIGIWASTGGIRM